MTPSRRLPEGAESGDDPRVTDFFQPFAKRAPAQRMNQPGPYFAEGHQHERPFAHSGMGDRQFRRIEHQVVGQQNVDVDDSRLEVGIAHNPAFRLFKILDAVQKRPRIDLGLETNNGIARNDRRDPWKPESSRIPWIRPEHSLGIVKNPGPPAGGSSGPRCWIPETGSKSPPDLFDLEQQVVGQDVVSFPYSQRLDHSRLGGADFVFHFHRLVDQDDVVFLDPVMRRRKRFS